MFDPDQTPSDQRIESEAHGLFSEGMHLTPFTRVAYFGFVVCGICTTFFTSLAVIVEVATSPRATFAATAVCAISAAIMLVHLIRFGRSPTKLSVTAWCMFLFALAIQTAEVWFTITDRIAQVVFTVMAVVGGTWLLLARLLCAAEPTPISRHSTTIQLLLVIAAWSPVLAVIALL